MDETNINKESSIGPIIGAIIILAVIILGGLYFWSERGDDSAAPETEDAAVAELGVIKEQSSSDETNAIEADLKATQIETLDADRNGS